VKPFSTRFILLVLFITLIGLYVDPAWANKFQTIGSGVSGSSKIKIEYLRISAYVISGLFLASSLLALFTRKRNAHELSYTAGKTSAIVFFLFSLGALTLALML
jgi:hypothetical protein